MPSQTPTNVTPQHLGNALIGAGAVSVYQVPAARLSTTIRSISISNLDPASPHKLSVWLVPPGGSPDNSNAIASALSIPASGVAQDDAVHVLMTGGQVIAQGDASTCFSIVVDGAENS